MQLGAAKRRGGWSGFRTKAALALAVLLATTVVARAAPRLALVDGADLPHLHEALAVSLAPWAIEVVDWPSGIDPAGEAPAPPLDAATIAKNANARYVVWYEGGELVVLDASLDRRDTRPADELPADEASASATALSVKTMLRLPPALAAQGRLARWRFFPSVRLGGRLALGGDGGSGLRAGVSLEVAPPRLFGVRFGVLGELGTATDVSRASFRGEWSEWNVQASLARDFALAPWTLGATIAGGISRATFSGEEMRVARDDSQLTACGSALASLGRPLGPVTAALVAGLFVRGAAQHVRDNGTTLFQEPSVLGALLASLSVPF